MSLVQREWVNIADPSDANHTWIFDVTFLLSHWECIFGRGCQGIYDQPTEQLCEGCCSYGAHFHDENDKTNVIDAALDLDSSTWQYIDVGRRKGVVARDGSEYRTRLVDGACIFLNRVGFPTGPGCALHFHSIKTGEHFSHVKPVVCWQVPLAREEHEDEYGKRTTRITEFSRSSWGDGGDDFAWWCIEDPNAFHHSNPVYQSMEEEIRLIVGDDVYTELSSYLSKVAPQAVHPTEQLLQIVSKPQMTVSTDTFPD